MTTTSAKCMGCQRYTTKPPNTLWRDDQGNWRCDHIISPDTEAHSAWVEYRNRVTSAGKSRRSMADFKAGYLAGTRYNPAANDWGLCHCYACGDKLYVKVNDLIAEHEWRLKHGPGICYDLP